MKATEEQIKKHSYYNKKWFDRLAFLYDIAPWLIRGLRETASKSVKLHKRAKVLDVATGTGEQALALAKLGHSVIGVDLSSKMLERAEKKIKNLDLRFKMSDATNLPFGDNTFDAAFISFGLHDMPYKIGQLVLTEMKRVVKSQGKIVIIDYIDPKHSWRAKIFSILAKLWERKLYDDFVKRGLESILNDAKLNVEKEVHWHSCAQIIVTSFKK